jgi:hypothetical protein
MPRAKPGQRFGGRAKGTPNKATLERQRRTLAELGHRAAQANKEAKDELAALIPEAKELNGVVKGIVARFQERAYAAPPGDPKYDPAAWEQLREWMQFYDDALLKAASIAHKAADFQSPRLKAVLVSLTGERAAAPSAPMTDVSGGTSDDRVARAQQTYLKLVKG